MKRWGLVVVLATLVARGVFAQDPARQLREAINMETIDGDVKGAIERYRKVAGSGDRVAAAQALLRLADAQAKLGQPDAHETLQTIVRVYPEQAAVVGGAQARLSAAATRPASRVQTELSFNIEMVLEGEFPGIFSPDEQTIVVGTMGKPIISIRSVAAGTTTPIVTMQENGWVRGMTYSPDGRALAYEWEAYGAFASSVFVVDAVAGAKPRALVTQSRGGLALPVGWSPDGRSVLVATRVITSLAPRAEVHALSWVSASGGPLQVAKTFEPWRAPFIPGGRALSPNGELIAYTARASEGSPDRYIYVCDAMGQNERIIVRLAGTNSDPVWTPDSQGLAFLNTRSGQSDLMFTKVPPLGTQPAEPVVIKRALGTFPAGTATGLKQMTRTGDLVYVQAEDASQQQLIGARSSGGQVQTPFSGQNGTWSPNGRTIAFIKTAVGSDLVLRDLASGAERVYSQAGLANVPPRWLSDSRRLIVRVNAAGDGGAAGSGGALYVIDTTTGIFTRLFARNTEDRERAGFVVAPDDKTMYAVARARGGNSSWTEIVAVDTATGASRLVVKVPGAGFPDAAPGLAVSPDGSTLAIRGFVDGTESNSGIFTVRTDGTDYRELVKPIKGFLVSDQMRWTPDGQFIVYTAFSFTGPQAEGGWRLMRVPVRGGAPEIDGLDSNTVSGPALSRLDVNHVGSLDLSPDGSRFVFSSRQAPAWSVWKVKNFLLHVDR